MNVMTNTSSGRARRSGATAREHRRWLRLGDRVRL